MTLEFVNDATFWPALPCQECNAEVDQVLFCLDVGSRAMGACEQHVAALLKQVLFEELGDCLVIRNEPVLPLLSADDRTSNFVPGRCG